MAAIHQVHTSPPPSVEVSFPPDMSGKLVILEQNAETPEHIEEKDAAALSSECRDHQLDTETLQLRLREQLAFLETILDKIINFTSSPVLTIEQEIKELSLLYQNFLERLSSSVCQKERPPLLHKLYRQLTHSADTLLRSRFPEITSFVETYHISPMKKNLHSALLYLITGKHGIETELQTPTPAKAGLLYGKDRQYSASFHIASTWEGETDMKDLRLHNSHSYKGKEALLEEIGTMNRSTIECIIKKVERVEQFIKYVNKGGDLYTNSPFTAKNDEFLGFVMAELVIKTQIFSESIRSPAPVASSLRTMIQKLIDSHIKTVGSKDIHRVYMHTMHLYQTSKDAKNALEKGLTYALEQFSAKKEDGAAYVGSPYNKESGFFQIKEMDRSPHALLAENIRLLEKDWKQFLKTLDGKGHYRLTEVFSNYSPWASALIPQPLAAEHTLLKFSTAKAAATAVILAGVLLFFLR